MTSLKPGDRVDCRVKSATIVSPYSSYDEVKTFEIVAIDFEGFYLYVPHYYVLKDTFVADSYQCKKLGIDRKFLDENVIHIEERFIMHVHAQLDGMNCKICNEFSQYSKANQADGTFICFTCKQNPYR